MFLAGEPALLSFEEGALTPSLGISSVHSSFFDSPRDGSPDLEGGPLHERSKYASNGAQSVQSLQSAAFCNTGQGDGTSLQLVPDDKEDGPSFRRAVDLANQGLGCATKLVRDRCWHHTSFKGVDEVLSVRAPAAPWLYQTSTKPPHTGHFMEADFVPLDVSASDHVLRDVAARETPANLEATSQSSLAPLKKQFSLDKSMKSLGEESTRSTVGKGVAELQAELETPWFSSDPALLHGKLSVPRKSALRPGGRPSALRSAAQSLIMTPRCHIARAN